MDELRALLNVILGVFSKPKVYVHIYGIKRMHLKRARIKICLVFISSRPFQTG